MFGLSHLQLWQSFNTRLTMAVLLIAISQFNFGFDQQGFATTQAMDAFDRQFGMYDSKKDVWYLPTTWLAFFNGFNYIGQAFGVLFGSWVSKHYGRRWCMFSMSCWAIVCAVLVITAKTRDQMMVARVMNYIYIGMELAVVPVFQSEITPPRARGFIVGTYQTSLNIGGLIMNLIARGTGSMESAAAYRIPFGLFFIVPTFVASCVWFIPESPRWLVLKDRPEDAKQSLRMLRQGKFSEEEINEELQAIFQSTQQLHKRGSLNEILQGTNLRRTMIVCGANFFFQATGQIFTSIYGAIFVKSLGTVNPFTITVTLAVVNVCTAFLAMTLLDRIGRRVLILVGASIQLTSLMAMGGLGTVKQPSFSTKSAIVAMMVVFNHGYSLGWAPVAHTLSPEIPNLYMRDMTYRVASVLNIVTQFTVSFSLPYMLNAPYGNLGSKVGFIFGSVAVVSIVFAYLCIPNCAKLTLEEIDHLFETHTATRRFQEAGRIVREEPTASKLDDEEAEELSERALKTV